MENVLQDTQVYYSRYNYGCYGMDGYC